MACSLEADPFFGKEGLYMSQETSGLVILSGTRPKLPTSVGMYKGRVLDHPQKHYMFLRSQRSLKYKIFDDIFSQTYDFSRRIQRRSDFTSSLEDSKSLSWKKGSYPVRF